MSGFALVQSIHEQWPNRQMKLVMLTSLGQVGMPSITPMRPSPPIFPNRSRSPIFSKFFANYPSSQSIETRAVRRDEQPQNPAKSLRILVADDNQVNQKVAQRMLERLGHTVALANDGKEALAAIKTASFDLVMMDIQMPEMDGFEATQRVREWEAGKTHIPIIALTAHAMDSHREECLTAGMDSFLAKPILLESLKLELERLTQELRPTSSR